MELVVTIVASTIPHADRPGRNRKTIGAPIPYAELKNEDRPWSSSDAEKVKDWQTSLRKAPG